MSETPKREIIPDAIRRTAASIHGVHVLTLPHVTMPTGFMMELLRTDWPEVARPVRQINWFQLAAETVTGWHCHDEHLDYLIGVAGTIKLALFDGRDVSPSRGATEVVRLGPSCPLMVIVPPGVWHGLRNESNEPAGYVQVLDALYNHKNPDSRKLPRETPDIPDIL